MHHNLRDPSLQCFRSIGLSIAIVKLGVLFCLLPKNALAREDIVPGSRYVSARGAAMGDAFLPMGRDAAAGLFYNPAIFGKLQGVVFEPLDASGYGNFNLLPTLGGSTPQVFNLSKIQPLLSASPETWVGVGGSITPTLQVGRFSVGFLLNHQIGGQANNNGPFRYRALHQMIPAAGFGFPFFKGRLRVGYSLQWVNQASGDITQVSTSGLDYSNGLSQGSGISHNLGIGFNIEKKFIPEINIVVRNIGGVRYSSNVLLPLTQNPVGVLSDEPMTIDVSLSISTRPRKKSSGSESLFPGKSSSKSGFNLAWVLQMRDLTNSSGVPFEGRLATGLELPLGNWALRAGWGTGYPSAGVGYVSRKFELGFCWYSEDISTVYHEFQDMRFMLHLQFAFR